MSNNSNEKISLLGCVIWGTASLFFLYEFFLRTFVGSLAHQIIPDLHLSLESFAIIGSAYYFTYGIMQIPVGILADKFGVKILLFIASLICAGATFWFSHAQEFWSAFFARFLMGFGSSFAFISLLTISMEWFPRKYFGFFVGAAQFVGTMGPLLAGGPLVSLMAKSGGNWRIPMSYISIIGVVLALLVLLLVKNKARDKTEKFIRLEKPSSTLVQLRQMIKNKQVWFIAFYSGTSYGAIALLGAIWGTEYLQTRGLSQDTAAYCVSMAWIGYAVGCPLMGVLSDLTRRRKPSLIFCSSLGIVVTLFISYLAINTAWIYAGLFFLLGIGASGQNVGFAAISEQVSNQARSAALGVNNAAVISFDTFMPVIIGFLITLSAGHIHGDVSKLRPENFALAFSIMPILYLAGLVVAIFLIKETYCKSQKETIVLTKSSSSGVISK
jgi:MFS family permease